MAVELNYTAAIAARRAGLQRERTRLMADVVALTNREQLSGEAQRLDGGPGGDDADIATEAFEQELASELARNAWCGLVEIDAALARMDAGEYGVCEDCNGVIDPERLSALPRARRCMPCQQRAETRARRRAA
ncbi:MAG: transcriptional regulator, TraR/DksA family [Chloroflexi bacterium]|nr:transcriptional regulator, TraR/DksA family [Chloroflexota bacterium]